MHWKQRAMGTNDERRNQKEYVLWVHWMFVVTFAIAKRGCLKMYFLLEEELLCTLRNLGSKHCLLKR